MPHNNAPYLVLSYHMVQDNSRTHIYPTHVVDESVDANGELCLLLESESSSSHLIFVDLEEQASSESLDAPSMLRDASSKSLDIKEQIRQFEDFCTTPKDSSPSFPCLSKIASHSSSDALYHILPPQHEIDAKAWSKLWEVADQS